jgi:hypothetical protein
MRADNNIVGVDPHRRTFTATVLDPRGGELGHAHFPTPAPGTAPRWDGPPITARSTVGESKARGVSADISPNSDPRRP